MPKATVFFVKIVKNYSFAIFLSKISQNNELFVILATKPFINKLSTGIPLTSQSKCAMINS
ncbi:MAG: hypothetical protein A2538_01400 [Candidatus Magasanikbacteria bacterium RIFOXYD2_FULL_41_14]|uniref:Uncharacterized protein n=1 Tax=Candidatus Magasanikbacteria bacterium RIFOXYD2_FULL_41_14 TaxID=1798709 RepID=A0A1F6PE03_9BACT|nr:MAG: hypothetical protein A2538_01400 [Candidatus Magasanikbacteria bacterium RIFOXYD2_FULL_41_14]